MGSVNIPEACRGHHRKEYRINWSRGVSVMTYYKAGDNVLNNVRGLILYPLCSISKLDPLVFIYAVHATETVVASRHLTLGMAG